jgi:cytochrome P450
MTLEIENDPFPGFDAMLDAGSVSWNDTWKMWAIAGHDDVVRVAADLERFSVEHGYRGAKGESWKKVEGQAAGELSSRFLRFTDPPVWDKVRSYHEAALPYPKLHGPESRPAKLRDQVQWIVSARLEATRGRDQIDAVHEWCQPLPCLISMAVLGLPPSDYVRLRRLTLDGILTLVRNPTDHDYWSDAQTAKANAAAAELITYLRATFDQKEAEPADDLISRLIAHDRARGKDGLGRDALIQLVADELMGGFHESSMATLADGLYLLLRTGQYRDLVADPSLAARAVEEIIRFHAFAPIAPRRAKVDVEIGGATIKAGDLLLLYFGAAQRDPARFPDGRRFDIHRAGTDNANLSFGTGGHMCVGQPQIRMLATVFFDTVARLYPDLRLAEWPENHYTSLRYQPRGDIVLLESLPLALAAGGGS